MNQKRPPMHQPAVQEAPSAPAVEATVEAVVAAVAVVEAPAPEPVKMGKDMGSLLKASVNDMHHYGVISDAEAVSLKERIEAKS